MAGKAVEKMIAQAVHEAVRNLREQEAQLEFRAFAEEGEGRKTRSIVDCYRDTLSALDTYRHGARCTRCAEDRRKWEEQAAGERCQLRRDYRDFAELHGEAVAEGLLRKAFSDVKARSSECLLTEHDIRFATGSDPW